METDIPVQTGPVYHCFNCGASPATFTASFRACGSALDAWSLYIWYLKLPCRCETASRVVRLGDWIAPLKVSGPEGLTSADIPAIQIALQAILKVMPPDKQPRDPAARIVYNLLAGSVSPVEAITQLHGWARNPNHPTLIRLPAPPRLTGEGPREVEAITFLRKGG